MATGRKTEARGTEYVMTVKEAAEALGVGINNIYRHLDDGTIPVVKIGSRRLIPRHQFRKLIGETP